MTTAASFHHLAISPFLQGLRNAHHFIQKGYTHVQTQSHSPDDYLHASLHPDMKDLIYQVQRFTDAAKFVPSRVNESVAGITLPDTEKTFEEVLERVQKTIDYLEGVKESDFAGKENEEVHLKFGKVEKRCSKLEYVLAIAQPNFW
jgi:hypothetical protein